MRILKVVCGIAVLLQSLHMIHAVHHFTAAPPQELMHGLSFWAAMTVGVSIGVFSFIGGILLLRQSR